MNLQAFISRRVVTGQGVQPAAILVEGEQIRAVVPLVRCRAEEFMISVTPRFFRGWWILTYTSTIPGGAEWEGFHTATRAAAAGGYTSWWICL